MKQFVVACVSMFDNEMMMKKVEAEDSTTALKKYLTEQRGYDFSNNPDLTVTEMQTIAFDSDEIVGVCEIQAKC